METPQQPMREPAPGSEPSAPGPMGESPTPPAPEPPPQAPPAYTPPAPSYAPPPPPPPPASWEAPPDEGGPAPGYVFGGFGERLLAYIIDVLIVGAIIIVLAIIGGLLVFVLPILSLVPFVGIIVVPLVYFPYFWARDGQTPGMRPFDLRVVRDRDGGPVSTGSAILRLIGYWVNSIVFYIGFIWIFIDKRKRGWHDLIAGTVVVKKL